MIKINGSSLIYSIKLNLINEIKELYKEIIISPTVKREVIDQGKKKGKPDALVAENYLHQNKIKIHTPSNILKDLNLGKGETEIISLAIEEKSPCMIDDIKAQKIGIKLNINLKCASLEKQRGTQYFGTH